MISPEEYTDWKAWARDFMREQESQANGSGNPVNLDTYVWDMSKNRNGLPPGARGDMIRVLKNDTIQIGVFNGTSWDLFVNAKALQFFGESKYSAVEPGIGSWLASNGQWNEKATYPDYYDWLVTRVRETITDNGGKVVLSTDTITDYDWVVNTEDETFRLPLLDGSESIPGTVQEYLSVSGSAQENNVSLGAQPFNCIITFGNKGQGAPACQILTNVTSGSQQSDTISSTGIFSVQTIFAKRGDTVVLYWNTSLSSDHYLRRTKCIGNGTLYFYVGDPVL